MKLPQDKKLVRVEYTYEDGSKYYLDEENSENFRKNIDSASSLCNTRSYWSFLPVEWQEDKEKNDNLV